MVLQTLLHVPGKSHLLLFSCCRASKTKQLATIFRTIRMRQNSVPKFEQANYYTEISPPIYSICMYYVPECSLNSIALSSPVPFSLFRSSSRSFLWMAEARMYPKIAKIAETTTTNSKVNTSCRVPLLYSIQYRLGVSHRKLNVTVEA
jgi:hypothetical protein